MNIKKVKTKNSEVYYLCKSFRDSKTKKSTSKIIEKLGSKKDIEQRVGKKVNIEKWLQDYAKKRTQEEKNNNKAININVAPNKELKNDVRHIYNAGYYAIRNMCYEIGLDVIFKDVCKKSKFNGDLFEIVSCMIYNRIINAFDEINTYDYSRTFIYPPKFTKFQLYRAIDVLSEYSAYIQMFLYNKLKPVCKKNNTLYFDRQTYIFDLEQSSQEQDWIRRNNLFVDYEVLMDCNGIPLAYNLPKKYVKFIQSDYINLQKTINEDWSQTKLIIFNNEPEQEISRKLNDKFSKCIYVKDQEIGKLPDNIKLWISDAENWSMVDNKAVYNLVEIKQKLTSAKSSYATYRKYFNASFYKSKNIKIFNKQKNTTEEKTLIVFFNYELQKIHAQERLNKILHIKKNIDATIAKNLENLDDALDNILNKYSKLLLPNTEKNNEINNKYKFKDDVFSYGQNFDGYYALIADKGDYNIGKLIKIHSTRWQIHQPFEKVNSEFKYMPQYINHENSVGAHFLLCSIMLSVWRMYINKFKSKSYSWEIANELSIMNYLEIPGVGWLPAFKPNAVTDLISKISNLDINYEFITPEKMKSILKKYNKQG